MATTFGSTYERIFIAMPATGDPKPKSRIEIFFSFQ
jgi:hypothetical protein